MLNNKFCGEKTIYSPQICGE